MKQITHITISFLLFFTPITFYATQPTLLPKITIFDAGILKQAPNKDSITLRNFPGVVISCLKDSNFVRFQVDVDNNSTSFTSGTAIIGEVYDESNLYSKAPTVTIESKNHSINPPHLQCTHCSYEWDGKSHDFFIYKNDNNSLHIEYIYNKNYNNFNQNNF